MRTAARSGSLEDSARTRAIARADGGTRTPDPFITSEVLYQLSYVGVRRNDSHVRWDVRVARTRWQRLLGLALRRRPGHALLIPRCRSVHTFGMRFRLDLHWLDEHGRVLRIDRAVPPLRFRSCRAAAAVVEVPADE